MDRLMFEALEAFTEGADRMAVAPLAPWVDPASNQPLLFVKPEITQLGQRAEPALRLVESTLERWKCRIESVLLLSPDYLRRHRLIEEHYGLINRYSVHGVAALPDEGRTKAALFAQELGIPIDSILGAHQFLETHPEVKSEELLACHEDARITVKLSSGAYCSLINLKSSEFGIVNGFHPAQLDHFYAATAPILISTLRTQTPWIDLRRNMIGATNPSAATKGSLRNELLNDQARLRITGISGMRNGIHLSAGPLEAAAETLRYLKNHDSVADTMELADTNIGSLMLGRWRAQIVEGLIDNSSDSLKNSSESPYDLTEEMDTAQALDTLAREIAG